MATAVSLRSPSFFSVGASRNHLSELKSSEDAERRPPMSFADVLRRDRQFLGRRLRSAAAPLAPLRDRFSTALGDIFWLRILEQQNTSSSHSVADQLLSSSSWPNIRHPPGLSGKDILMADLEAIKVYANYLKIKSKAWSLPLPEHYEPQRISLYFSCRPHVIAYRIIQVILSLGSAAAQIQLKNGSQNSIRSMERDTFFDSSKYYMGQVLKECMLSLGPAFIKVGQSLSTRPDLIGFEISKALSELHDKVPPFPRAIAMSIIEEELGCPVEDNFRYISEEPLAAASFGQVYQGCTLDGCIVAVKVQRPNLLPAVVRDVYILRLGLVLLRNIAKRKSDLCLYADEVGKGLVGELDYQIEAANASEFREAHSCYPFISVPKVYEKLSKKRVLTMEWVTGESPSDLLSLSRGAVHKHHERLRVEARKRLMDLVNKGVEASLVQLLETGLLHADPHPGNLCYTPDGRIGFLDFGLVCRMEKKHQNAMLASIIHIVNGDWGALVCDLTEMDVVRPGTNLRVVTMDLENSLGEVAFEDGIPNLKFSKVLGKIWSVALKYHFRMPPYFTLLLRSLASLEGLALAADPGFKTFQAAYPYVVTKLLYDNSAATRKILFSVVFNKRKEFQWKKITLLLSIGSMRKSANSRTLNTALLQNRNSKLDTYEIANLLLRLLSSKDGVVLRRLLMEADPVSLCQAIVSKHASFYRQHASRALADLMFHWVVEISSGKTSNQCGDGSLALRTQPQKAQLPTSRASLHVLQSVLKDLRLKLIFYKMVNGIRNRPMLMLKLIWCCFAMSSTAVAFAWCSFVGYWSELHLASVLHTPKRLAVGGT